MATKTEYEWVNGNMADQVLRKLEVNVEGAVTTTVASAPSGFVMKSGPTSYTAWIATDKQNHTGNRMEFYDMDTAKAWVFAQVRMNDGTALLRSSCVC
jgi:ribonuclease HI